MSTSPLLKVTGLGKRYGSAPAAVRNLSFSVNPGEIFALIGPNGAGKSTTLKIIATLLTATEGKVEIDGRDIATQADQVRHFISYLPEEAGAYKNLSGNQYLRFMAALLTETHEAEAKAITFAQEITALGDRLNDKISTYSKGMVRKLLLARTVMTRPTLAILDEPTSGLDVMNAWDIREIIKRLAKEGMTVLLSSHNMLEIERLSDRVGIIDQGELKAEGTAQELKEKYHGDNLEEVFVSISRKGK